MAKKVKTNLMENAGKLMLDVGKLTFASLILGGILRGKLEQITLIIAGAIVFVFCTVVGLAFTTKKTESNNKE